MKTAKPNNSKYQPQLNSKTFDNDIRKKLSEPKVPHEQGLLSVSDIELTSTFAAFWISIKFIIE